MATRAGIRRAKAQGTKTGAPFGRPKVDAMIETAIRKALAKGHKGIRRIAVEFGVGTGTAQRIAEAMLAGITVERYRITDAGRAALAAD